MESAGADSRNRTCNLMITNQLLYHLSYTGIEWAHHARGRDLLHGTSRLSEPSKRSKRKKEGKNPAFAGGTGRRI